MRDPGNRETIELRLDNRQIVSFVIGSLVVLGVVFALGVLVGKQLAVGSLAQPRPSDPLATLDAKEKALEAVPDAGNAPDAGTTLSFASELTRPKQVSPVIEPTRPPASKPAAEPTRPAVKPAAEAKPEKAEGAAGKGEGPEAQAKGGEAAAKPAVAKAAESKAGLSAAFDKAAGKSGAESYTLQVASLPSRAEAEKVVAKLKSKGYSPSIAEATVEGKGRVWRVRVGAYASRADADEAARAFKKKAGMAALVSVR